MEFNNVKIEDSCERAVTAEISGLPDMIDNYGSQGMTFRPDRVRIKYVLCAATDDDEQSWELHSLTVSGSNVKKDGLLGQRRGYSYWWRVAAMPEELASKVNEYMPKRLDIDVDELAEVLAQLDAIPRVGHWSYQEVARFIVEHLNGKGGSDETQ